tara:strand:- start:642 stop:803 length:162 start_codon:yes stop_codon:yes gene_type:complete
MDSERNFVPKPEKPPLLFHGSANKSIDRFVPKKVLIGLMKDLPYMLHSLNVWL